jgi:hypothetical protein
MGIKALGHTRHVSESSTAHDLELCLVEDHHEIQKWIANRWLRDGVQGTRRHEGNVYNIHRLRDKDVVALVKQLSQEINIGTVNQVLFLDLLMQRGTELRETYASRHV